MFDSKRAAAIVAGGYKFRDRTEWISDEMAAAIVNRLLDCLPPDDFPPRLGAVRREMEAHMEGQLVL